MPRLGAAYDLSGTGRWIAQATYGHYAGKYTEPNFQDDTDVGNPGLVTYEYTGPAGQGVDFAARLRPRELHALPRRQHPDRQRGLRRRHALAGDEGVHGGAGARRFGDRGAAKVSYQWRSVGGFIEDFIDDPSAAGKVHGHAATASRSARSTG